VHTTSRKEDAGTDEGFNLIIRSVLHPEIVVGTKRFPDLPHDERESGRTDEYEFDVEGLGIDMSGVNHGNICIEILGDDAWLPRSIWVMGEDVEGTRQLLVGLPRWPDDLWFSTDRDEGERSRVMTSHSDSSPRRQRPIPEAARCQAMAEVWRQDHLKRSPARSISARQGRPWPREPTAAGLAMNR